MTSKQVFALRGLRRDENGSALIEGAIVVPVFAALILGALEFSYMLYEQHGVSTGVRDAARFLARTNDPTVGSAQTAAQNLASTASVNGGSYRRVKGFDPNEVTVNVSLVANPADVSTKQRPYREASIGCGGPDNIRIVTVTGSFVHSSMGFLTYFGFSPKTITVTQSERCIGLS